VASTASDLLCCLACGDPAVPVALHLSSEVVVPPIRGAAASGGTRMSPLLKAVGRHRMGLVPPRSNPDQASSDPADACRAIELLAAGPLSDRLVDHHLGTEQRAMLHHASPLLSASRCQRRRRGSRPISRSHARDEAAENPTARNPGRSHSRHR
jgi:hypothetical protein